MDVVEVVVGSSVVVVVVVVDELPPESSFVIVTVCTVLFPSAASVSYTHLTLPTKA